MLFLGVGIVGWHTFRRNGFEFVRTPTLAILLDVTAAAGGVADAFYYFAAVVAIYIFAAVHVDVDVGLKFLFSGG